MYRQDIFTVGCGYRKSSMIWQYSALVKFKWNIGVVMNSGLCSSRPLAPGVVLFMHSLSVTLQHWVMLWQLTRSHYQLTRACANPSSAGTAIPTTPSSPSPSRPPNSIILISSWEAPSSSPPSLDITWTIALFLVRLGFLFLTQPLRKKCSLFGPLFKNKKKKYQDESISHDFLIETVLLTCLLVLF